MASQRKLRLFACAFWRLWWQRPQGAGEAFDADPDADLLLECAERWAEGGNSPGCPLPGFRWHPLVARGAFDGADWTVRETAGFKSRIDPRRYDAKDRALAAEFQVRLLREVFGNPFRPAVVDPRWRTPAVANLARHIYDDRNFVLMPVLADALEDAGCGNEELLGHLRGPGPHVRGCFAIDLLLGME